LYIFLAFLFSGCAKEEDISNTADKVGVSRVVFFPVIATKGDRLVIINQGQTYSDAGAVATLGDKTVPYTTTGSVNTATPGIYTLSYTAINDDGFSASDFRSVAVIGNDVSTNDYSGAYARYVGGTPNGQSSTWTKTAPGVYTVINPGGAAGVTATAVNYSGNLIAIPPQLTEAGLFSTEISATSGIYYPTPAPAKYEWSIVNPGYGTALRTFVKQ
jgi:hypothetical protein